MGHTVTINTLGRYDSPEDARAGFFHGDRFVALDGARGGKPVAVTRYTPIVAQAEIVRIAQHEPVACAWIEPGESLPRVRTAGLIIATIDLRLEGE